MTSPQTAIPHAEAAPTVRIRASDAERGATVDLLQDAMTRGLLTHDEGSERMATAFATVYRDELPALTADLPPAEPVRAPASGWPALLAMLGLQLRHELRATRAAGIRSKRFVGTVLVALLLTALVVSAVIGIVHGVFDGGGFDGGRDVDGGPGFPGGR